MQVLQAPTVLHEIAGEPVEQLRVGRRFSLATKVVGRADQSLAEVPSPDAVHENASRKRVVGCRQPACQRRPSPFGGTAAKAALRRMAGTAGDTASRGLLNSPRCNRWTGSGCGRWNRRGPR